MERVFMQHVEKMSTKPEATVHVRVNGAHGISLQRMFSDKGINPLSKIIWEKRTALISNEKGEEVFRQDEVEVPAFWSQMATNIAASKYFRGPLGSPQRESSIRELVCRVVDTVTAWGKKEEYFASDEQAQIFRDELVTLLVEQYGSFNSPVWFNVGVESDPQCSACFILSVHDTMESLLDLQKTEAMLFKYGSGAGSNLSEIRSRKEQLSGGGTPSGPVSFMRGYDAWAGTIKSGGKTRRAAKMQILDVDHPDIFEFVNAKRLEEQKARALIQAGYSSGFSVTGGAYDSVFFQNSNLSVRVSDEFMEKVVEGEKFPTRRRTDQEVAEWIDARELLQEISKACWECGDPGLQFDTTINRWHTCPESGKIKASNPCSEYMHLDDTACNLASLNLLKFLGENGEIDVSRLRHAVDIFLTAQDIIVNNASYPTPRIAERTKKFRQLGLGYANLGALLMSQGLAYDSDEGRGLAAALTAIISGEAYRMSSVLASQKMPFDEYEPDMLKVIEMHLEAANKLPQFPSTTSLGNNLVQTAQLIWKEVLSNGQSHGFRNSQTTVIAPTGTIGFLMDCDTTGIEPDIALVKYKKLVGGGSVKITNQSVSRALRYLGYSPDEVTKILSYIDLHDTIEGAPGLQEEHLPVFDCAFRPLSGERSIHYMGHVKMMAAVQPFISGAISKTVNFPEQGTAEEIQQTFIEAWKLGLKAIAIYRDNSKTSQPLVMSEKSPLQEGGVKRRRLPDERQAITHKFSIAGHEGYLTVGLFEDGSPGEIFLVMAKEGSTLSGVMDAFATSISLALQYGVPLSALVKKFSHMRFEPSGFTSSKQVPYAKSILDYIFRWLAAKFLSHEEQVSVGVIANGRNEDSPRQIALAPVSGTKQGIAFELSEDAPPCLQCGSSLMIRQGPCYRCLNCGSQEGCG